MNREIWTDIYTVLILCIKQITNENLLYSTGNSTQCSVVTKMGRKSKREGMYVDIQQPPWWFRQQSAMQETQVQSLGWEDPLEKRMATYSSTLAQRIPWTEKSGGLQSIRSQRVRHDWVTFTFVAVTFPFIADLLCCTVETNTTLQSNYTSIKINLIKEKRRIPI